MLEEIQIEGFRSLKSVTWKPGKLNVLIGPNGGGKSNLLRVLDLLRISASGGLKQAILRMGGMIPLLWDQQAEQICFRLRGACLPETPQPARPAHLEYQLALQRVGNTGGYRIGMESFRDADPGRERLSFNSFTETSLASASEASSEPQHELRTALLSWCVYFDLRVDQDAELRHAAVTRLEKRVDADGQNLVAVLHTLYTTDREFEEFIDSSMATAFPDDYEKLSFPPAEDGRVQLRLKRKHRKRADSASDLSDGTLRFLLLLTILGSPDAGSLIAIDEPETGLHPRMMSIIAAAAANAALKSQIIFTTHSPSFLDAFPADDPPQTTVVTSNGSETQLKTISGEELKKWIEEYSLGKFAFSGEAEAVL